ncbi:hypothetical protein SRHO_G00146820 [Serrasalmus rhombeus]
MVSPELRSWIIEHSPTSTDQAVTLAEAYIAARQAEGTFRLGDLSTPRATSVIKLKPQRLSDEEEVWYVPHHMVSHNRDIKGMFHQICLHAEDHFLLRFIWHNMSREEPVAVYEWQVLPFGTSCSPCCATFALQHHVTENSQPGDEVRFSVEKCFYIDNCLQSLPTIAEARHLVDKLRSLLMSAGFELRQWASNKPGVISHLPEEVRSDSPELWLADEKKDSAESTLGLSWHFQRDILGYKYRLVEYGAPTMRNIYKVLASKYDPLVSFCSIPLEPICWREMHVFCDASEQVYGSVAYLRTVDGQGRTHLSFLMACSRVAPKHLHSMPRLELSQVLQNELTLSIDKIVLWTDSTTILAWLKSESCHFKVFVGTKSSRNL